MKSVFAKCLLLACSLIFVLPLAAIADGAEPSVAKRTKAEKRDASSAKESSDTQESGYQGPRLSEFDLARYQYCGSDEDCVVAINGCCDCANGGEEVAINVNRLSAFEAEFKCQDVACGATLHKQDCGRSVVSCIEHRCKLFAEEAAF